MRITATVLILAALFAPAAAAKRKTKKKRAPRPPAVFTVAPSEAIEQRVEAEVAKADSILEDLSESNLFDSPYLAAAMYYRDGFLADFDDEKPQADPGRRIVARLDREITPERRSAYVALLRGVWSGQASDLDSAPALVLPVPVSVAPPAAAVVRTASRKSRKKARVRWRRRASNHEYALDLFVREGTGVESATRGVVILADQGWIPGQAFVTTSQKGGNSVIVFDPDGDRFFRYAHLDRVSVKPGQIVHAGDAIGTVGHTGLNASRPRHGGHLHLEVNQFEDGQVRALRATELRTLLRSPEVSRVEIP